MYYSQYEQDKILNETIFKNKQEGFFLDIGAHDGIWYSNSYFFEKNLNWDGICVEPNPVVFEKLIKNRKAKCLNVGMWNESKILEFCKITGYAEMLSGFLESYHPTHKMQIDNEIKQFGGKKQILKIECISFNDLIKEHNVKKIDLLTIDVEGAEQNIIYSIDFSEIDIDVIICENNYNDKKIQNYLKQGGYSFIRKIKCDDVYRKI